MPVMGYWAAQVQFGTAVIETWLPADDAARVAYQAYREDFGDDQFLIIAWPDCDLLDPRMSDLAGRLRQVAKDRPELAIADVQDSGSAVRALSNLLRQQDDNDAKRRLKGFAVGNDGECFVTLKLSQADNRRSTALVEAVQGEIRGMPDLELDEIVLAGEPFQIYMIERASRESMQYYVIPSSLTALGVAWLCLRRIRLTLLVFSLSGLGQLIGLALVSFFLGEISAVLIVLPTLIFMLTLSAAIHLANYYLDSGGLSEPLAGARALILGWLPCVLATLTTVFGFASLVVSQLAPIWQFGSLAAVGLIVASCILLSVFAAATYWMGSRNSASKETEFGTLADTQVDSAATPKEHLSLEIDKSRTEVRLADFTGRYASILSVLGLLLLGFAAAGVQRLKSSTEFEDMFGKESPSVRSLEWVKQHLGPIDSFEILIGFPKEAIGSGNIQNSETQSGVARVDVLARLGLVWDIHQQIVESEQVHSVLSPLTFLPELPVEAGARNTIRRAVIRRSIEANRQSLRDQGLLSDQAALETWRLTARMNNITGGNYLEVRDRIVQRVAMQLEDFNRLHPECTASASLTGLRTVIEEAHRALIWDLGSSFAAAFLLITPVMMLITRGVFSGLILMVPNLLPVAFVFGCMGWLAVQLDVASILTASVALGIAVDDTLHFISWFLRGRRAGKTPQEAVRLAVGFCARPMFHTTLICTGAMLPFLFSDFIPTRKFAFLMILILNGAILGDLILLPAILQSPLGWIVGKDRADNSRRIVSSPPPSPE